MSEALMLPGCKKAPRTSPVILSIRYSEEHHVRAPAEIRTQVAIGSKLGEKTTGMQL